MSDVILNDEYDFGFTTWTEQDFSGPRVEEYQKRLIKMHSLIIPLINNLLKDADKKPVINWPNRKKKLEEFKGALDELVTGVSQI